MKNALCVWVFDESFRKAKFDSKSNSLRNVGNLIHHVGVGDALIISRYDFERQAAQIIKIGEVTETDISSEELGFEVVSTDFLITPGPSGRRHWQKPFFILNPERVLHYNILNRFADTFNNEAWNEVRVVDRSNNIKSGRKPSLHIVEGYVYIWRWRDEFKIGKALDVERRKKQVTKSTGRETVEIHRIFSTDYTRAEAELHQKFHEKRIRNDAGVEWFALTPEDVEWLKSISVFEALGDETS